LPTSGMANAIWPVRRDRSVRAAALGTYPIASAASVTRSCVAALVRIPFITREAEATDTFASRATVMIVGTVPAGSWDVGCVSGVSISEKDY
jgi:hypothetical protein